MFPHEELCPQVTVQWGGETVDLSGAVLGRITIRHGGQSEGPVMPPSRAVFDLADPDGMFAPNNPMSPYWPHVDIAAHLRIELPAGMVPEGDSGLFAGEVTTWQPYWLDGVEDEARIAVVASGVLERLSNGDTPFESAMRRHYLARIEQLASYTPLEDGPGTTRSANLVPGTIGPAYSTGSAPEYPNRPGYALDDSMPGSAPTPIWPVRDYLSWSVGATLRPFGALGDTAYVMQVAVRVPPDAGATWLHEWRTAGGRYTYWALRTTSGGIIRVEASDEADSPDTATYTSTAPAVDDGVWRVVQVGVRAPTATTQQVQIQIGDHNDTFNAASTPVGSAERMRTRPMYDNPTDKDPIGAAHAACVLPASTSVAAMAQLLSTPPPVEGHAGERAVRRIERLCAAEQVPLRILWGGMALLDDQFEDRAVVDGWGDPWQITGTAAAFTVADGQATIEPTTSGTDRTAYVADQAADVQCRTRIGVEGVMGQGQAGVILRRVDDDHRYEAMIRVLNTSGDELQIDLWLWKVTTADGYTLIGSAGIDVVDFEPGLRWNLVAEIEGATLRARAWREGTPEPDWLLQVVDGDITAPGGYGTAAYLFDGPQELFVFDRFLAVEDTSIRMGPQQRSTLLGNLQQASEVDSGILAEDRTTVGLIYRPLHGLVNQDPVLELSCHTAEDGTRGQISSQYTPSLDTRFVRNDRTITRIGGSSAQAVQTSGPRAIHPPPHGVGRFPDSTPLNAQSDTQLAALVSWWLYLGVQTAMRLPTLPIDLAASPELIQAWMRCQLGDRIGLVGLPRQQHAPVRALLQGWTAQLDAVDWRVAINASPYDPYEIGVVADVGGEQDVRGQAVDSDHSRLADDVDDAETEFEVATDANHPLRGLWTTDSDDWDTTSVTTRGVIVAWPGSEASIPAGWRRVRELDGRYPKGVSAAGNATGVAGGASGHSHTTGGHSHTTNHSHSTPSAIGGTSNSVKRQSGSGDDAFSTGHSHSWPSTATANVSSGAASAPADEQPNDPAHVEVIWIEARETATGIPDDAVTLSAAGTVPADWSRVYTGLFFKGAGQNTGGGTEQPGNTSHQHSLGAHTHTGSSHSHTSADSGTSSPTVGLVAGSLGTLETTHSHEISINSGQTAALASASGGTSDVSAAQLPPFTRVSAVRNNTGSDASVPAGTIAAWMGTADELPDGWVVCDGTGGTPDLMGRYPRGASSAGEHGDHGGSTAGHSHTSGSHSHSTSSHSHAASTGTPKAAFITLVGRGSGSQNVASANHRHNIGSTSQATPSVGSSTSGTLETAETEPEHTTVLWIMAVDAGASLTADTDGPPRHGGPLDITIGGEHMRIVSITGDLSPQTFTVERAVNGVRKPHPAGTPVNVAYPARIGL